MAKASRFSEPGPEDNGEKYGADNPSGIEAANTGEVALMEAVELSKVQGRDVWIAWVDDEEVGRISRKAGDFWRVQLGDYRPDIDFGSATSARAYVLGYFDGRKSAKP